MFIIVGVITRAISVATDTAVLGFTLWKTAYIFKQRKAIRSGSKLTTMLVYDGNKIYLSGFIVG